MSEEIVLYDLPSKDPCRSWSANTLKTQLVLNYKKIPFKTEWVPFHRLQETLKATGVEPQPPGDAPNFVPYTVPLIKLPSGKHVMDSEAIAAELESIYPSPSLHLNPTLRTELSQIFGPVFGPLRPYFMPRIARDICVPEDVDWFIEDRSRRLGVHLFEVEKLKGGDAAFEAARPGLEKLCAFLREHKKDEGPFTLGSVPSYVDFMIVAALHMFKVLGEEPFEKFVSHGNGELRKLYEASKQWC